MQCGWKPYHQFRGPTVNTDRLSCHVSVLIQNHSPHPPHTHPEEEILLMLAGEADLILPEIDSAEKSELRLRPGQFVYYPAQFPHTLRAVSPQPANYLMFQWLGSSGIPDAQLAFGCFDALGPRNNSVAEYGLRLLFEGPTGCIRKLHAHATTLTAGVAHPPHKHDYEAAIVVLEGEVETLGQRVGPHGIIFYSSGCPHSICNPGSQPARYVVFEFFGASSDISFFRKIADPERWKRKLKAILRPS